MLLKPVVHYLFYSKGLWSISVTSSSLPALLVSSDYLPGHGILNGRRIAANQLLRQWGGMAQESSVCLLGADAST